MQGKAGVSRIRNRVCVLGVSLPEATLSVYYTERANGTDAYNHAIFDLIKRGMLNDRGFFANGSMRLNNISNTAQLNASNQYPRRIFLRFTPAGQTRAIRREGQIILRDILMAPENNQFGSSFTALDEDDFTTTPMACADTMILDAGIVDGIFTCFPGADNRWFNAYPDFARSFFTSIDGRYPRCAITRLGYPDVDVSDAPVEEPTVLPLQAPIVPAIAAARPVALALDVSVQHLALGSPTKTSQDVDVEIIDTSDDESVQKPAAAATIGCRPRRTFPKLSDDSSDGEDDDLGEQHSGDDETSHGQAGASAHLFDDEAIDGEDEEEVNENDDSGHE